jgi:hypothetical protein
LSDALVHLLCCHTNRRYIGHKVEAKKPALMDRWALMSNGHRASSAEPASFYPPQRDWGTKEVMSEG